MEIKWWHLAVALVIGMIAELFWINQEMFLQPASYRIGACTFNGNLSCGPGQVKGWNGQCTPAIEDACCPDCEFRDCGSYKTENPSMCYTRWCTATSQFCVPGDYDTATTKYTCKCQEAEYPT